MIIEFKVIRNIWTTVPENLMSLHVNNKGADQPAHPCSLIIAFVTQSLFKLQGYLNLLGRKFQHSSNKQAGLRMTRPQGYKTFFMLYSTEHEISTTDKS